MNNQTHKTALEYIHNHWGHLMACTSAGENKTYIDVPNVFVSPGSGLFHCDQFYWDSYFIMLGLVEHEDYVDIARGIVDNFVFLFNTFGLVPMRNRTYDTGISQPPLLTSMIRLVYEKTNDKTWLKKTIRAAENELNNYWMNSDPQDQIVDHKVFEGLSRYADHHLIDQTAEHESGWDMTSRFNNHALQYVPVDLNSLLYKYEADLAWAYKILKNAKKSTHYKQQATRRAETINTLLFNAKKGFYFDYNYQTQKLSSFHSIAGFLPLWAGLATPEHAKKVPNHLKKFEQSGGVAATTKKNLLKPYRQWDYPNGWAPHQWFTVVGLENYGYKKDAERIRNKWIQLNLEIFTQTGAFWEKYDVVKRTIGQAGRYPTQSGFGWTNGVFVAFSKKS